MNNNVNCLVSIASCSFKKEEEQLTLRQKLPRKWGYMNSHSQYKWVLSLAGECAALPSTTTLSGTSGHAASPAVCGENPRPFVGRKYKQFIRGKRFAFWLKEKGIEVIQRGEGKGWTARVFAPSSRKAKSMIAKLYWEYPFKPAPPECECDCLCCNR